MITRHDLETAIAECQGKQNPDSRDCIKLAAFYTIRREMFGEEKEAEPNSYSYAPAPVRNFVDIDSDGEFARAVNGMDLDEFLSVINELMGTLQIVQPRLYDAVMMKLS